MSEDRVSEEAAGLARRALWAGAAVAAVALAMAPFNPRQGCAGPLAASPIISFELMRGPEGAAALFGEPGACQADLLRRFFIVDCIDYAFMPAYGAFVGLGLLTALASRGPLPSPRLRALALAPAVAAPLCDAIENVFLLTFTPGDPLFAYGALTAAVAGKFTLLGVVALATGVAMLQGPGARRLLGLLQLAPLPLTLAAVAGPARLAGLLDLAFAPAWLSLLLWAWLTSRRGAPSPS